MAETVAGPPAPRLRRDAARNHAALLAAAQEVFAAGGLDASLEEVARRAGVSIGTLYHRFRNRAALVDAAFLDKIATAVTSAERALELADPWQALVEHLLALGELQARDRGFTEVCVIALPPGSESERVKARGQQVFATLVQRARDSGQLRADVSVGDIGLLVWSAVRATEGVRSAAPDAWRRHLGVVLDGLRAAGATPLPGAGLDDDAVRAAMAFGRR